MILKGKTNTYRSDFSQLLAPVGKFSAVYVGVNTHTNQKIAIKTTPPGRDSDNELIHLLKHESTFQFTNPGIIKILDYIEEAGAAFIISEHIDGQSLKSDRKRIDYKGNCKSAIELALQILPILHTIHEQECLHGDIKPSNILLTNNSEPVIIDFGHAIRLKSQPEDIGTKPFSMAYSAPEIMLNFRHLANVSSDLFSLGMILYELITGELPFRHEQPLVSLTLQLSYPLPQHPLLPPSLHQILQKATSKSIFRLPPSRLSEEEITETLNNGISKRYCDAMELYSDLKSILAEPLKKRKWFNLF